MAGQRVPGDAALAFATMQVLAPRQAIGYEGVAHGLGRASIVTAGQGVLGDTVHAFGTMRGSWRRDRREARIEAWLMAGGEPRR